jgi:hypothetical protein
MEHEHLMVIIRAELADRAEDVFLHGRVKAETKDDKQSLA